MIYDTDILIWYFRGNQHAKTLLEKNFERAISSVTLMELIQGARNKDELFIINKFIHANKIPVYYINEEINLHAIHLLQEHTLSDGTEWGDALIAATALYYGEEICTANIKHYRCFPNLRIKKFSPRS